MHVSAGAGGGGGGGVPGEKDWLGHISPQQPGDPT